MWILTIYANISAKNLSSAAAAQSDDQTYREPQQQLQQQQDEQQYQQSYRLVGSTEYTIGRKDCMVLLPSDDPSISRHHATIIVSATPAVQLNNPTTFFPKVHVVDFSKHGTIINGVNVPPLTKKESAKSGSTIVFGRSVVGVLNYAPLICFISRTVHPRIAEQLKVQVAQLCGFVAESDGEYSSLENTSMVAPCWTQDELREAGVSPSCFLYVAEGLAPEKGLMTALLERYCLVSPAYIAALARCVKDTPATPLASIPPPSSAEAPRDATLERLPYRRPEPQIYDALEFTRAAPLNPSATFRTFHFIFLEDDVHRLYQEAVRRGGARATSVTPYDVLAWYQKNTNAVATASFASFTNISSNNISSGTKTADPLLPPADNAFPLRYLLQDREAHGTNTFVVASHRSFIATLDLIQRGIEEGAVSTKKANRTIVQLPTPSGTVADSLALLYLKARVPLVRDTNIMYALYAEDAAAFIAGHSAERSPTNANTLEAERLHFEFADPSLAASALQVELEEASLSGLLHAPKRSTNYLVQSSASRERNREEKKMMMMRSSSGGGGHGAKKRRGDDGASPSSLLMVSALDDLRGQHVHRTSRSSINNNSAPAGGDSSPASSVSTVDMIRPYNVSRGNANNDKISDDINNATPTKSALISGIASGLAGLAGQAGSSNTTRSPTSKQIQFADTARQLRGDGSSNGGVLGSNSQQQQHPQGDDGLNDDEGVGTAAGRGLNRYSSGTGAGSFSRRQEVVCCKPERVFSKQTLSPKRERDLVLRKQQEHLHQMQPDTSADALYAKWQSFYDSAREGDLVRAQMMYESKQQNAGSAVGRRRAASPGLAAVASGKVNSPTSFSHPSSSSSSSFLTNNNNNNIVVNTAATVSVGTSYSPHAAFRSSSRRPVGQQKINVPFAVSQSSLTRGGSPIVMHRRNVVGDISVPASAPFAAKALGGIQSPITQNIRHQQYSQQRTASPSTTVAAAAGATPRLLMTISANNIDHRLLQYCQELETHSLPEVETEVLHANSQHSQGLIYVNVDILKQRVMRYLVDIDLLVTESRRFQLQAPRPGSTGARRAPSPLVLARRDVSPSSTKQRSGSATNGAPRTSPVVTRPPSSAMVTTSSPVMSRTTNEAHRLALDCRSRLSVLMTVLEGPDFQPRHQQLQQQQQQQWSSHRRPSSPYSLSSPVMGNSNSNNNSVGNSRYGYYNLTGVDSDQDRERLQKIEDALHSPRGSTRIAEERASSQRTAERILNQPRATHSPVIPFNTSLLTKK